MIYILDFFSFDFFSRKETVNLSVFKPADIQDLAYKFFLGSF